MFIGLARRSEVRRYRYGREGGSGVYGSENVLFYVFFLEGVVVITFCGNTVLLFLKILSFY